MSERKPRKPLIEPGSILGEQPDIMSKVLNAYADRTGQAAPFTEPATPPPVEEPQAVAPQAEPKSAAQREPVDDPSVSSTTRQHADKPATKPKGKSKRNLSAEEDARVRALTPKRLCSYRVPEGLDDWLEEQVFENRHSGVKKQDLIAQAIQLLMLAKANSEPSEEMGG